jgi:hypothetical protein
VLQQLKDGEDIEEIAKRAANIIPPFPDLSSARSFHPAGTGGNSSLASAANRGSQADPTPGVEPQAMLDINPQYTGGVSTQSQCSPAWDISQANVMSGRSEIKVPREANFPKYRGEVLLAPSEPETEVHISTWTCITADTDLIQHLLALYFCWEYPTFATISKEHFLKDFHQGRPRHCSKLLVNALLALGCRFSTHPLTRADPNDPHTSGDHFFKESQRLLHAEEDHHSLTTIQALGIMSIREASAGRYAESSYYAVQSIRMAVELGLHQIDEARDEDMTAAQVATFWGAFGLNQ